MQGEAERLRDHCTFWGGLRVYLLSSEVLTYLFINQHSTSSTASFQGIVEERTATPSQVSQRLGEGLGSGLGDGAAQTVTFKSQQRLQTVDKHVNSVTLTMET